MARARGQCVAGRGTTAIRCFGDQRVSAYGHVVFTCCDEPRARIARVMARDSASHYVRCVSVCVCVV